ncbi:unnamed protein product [Victoria cruziana]
MLLVAGTSILWWYTEEFDQHLLGHSRSSNISFSSINRGQTHGHYLSTVSNGYKVSNVGQHSSIQCSESSLYNSHKGSRTSYITSWERI